MIAKRALQPPFGGFVVAIVRFASGADATVAGRTSVLLAICGVVMVLGSVVFALLPWHSIFHWVWPAYTALGVSYFWQAWKLRKRARALRKAG